MRRQRLLCALFGHPRRIGVIGTYGGTRCIRCGLTCIPGRPDYHHKRGH